MIVATLDFEMSKILANKDNPEELISYVESLVPKQFRHLDAIISNQRYYINFAVLQSGIVMEDKTAISKILVDGIHVVGYLDEFIAIDEIVRYVSMTMVNKYHEKEIQDGKGY